MRPARSRSPALPSLAMAMVLAVAVVLAASACQPSSDPITLVESLRVLTVRAEPPEVGLDGTVVMSPLTVDPKGGGRPLTHAWRACDPRVPVYDPELDCPVDTAFALTATATATADGSQAELSVPQFLTHLAGGASLAELEAQLGMVVGSDSRAGISVSVLYTVSAAPTADEMAAGQEPRVVTLKRVTLSTNPTPNQNPRLMNLQYAGMDWVDLMSVPFEKAKEVELGALLDPASFEVYPAQTPDGNTQDKAEELSLSWFITDGMVEGRQRDYIDPTAPPPADQPYVSQTTKYTLPDARPDGVSTFWLVLIDGRGGVDWQSARLAWQ